METPPPPLSDRIERLYDFCAERGQAVESLPYFVSPTNGVPLDEAFTVFDWVLLAEAQLAKGTAGWIAISAKRDVASAKMCLTNAVGFLIRGGSVEDRPHVTSRARQALQELQPQTVASLLLAARSALTHVPGMGINPMWAAALLIAAIEKMGGIELPEVVPPTT
jgi:hypothetical protein